jgi:probable phosphoglycerate mutase
MADEILLIRHGETDSNAARIVQLPEAPLSERGREQARRLAARIASEGGVTSIVTSDLRRAHETAAAISAATGIPLVLEPLLQERSFGDFRGTAYADLPVDIFAPGVVPPGGESIPEFARRVDRAWDRIRELAAQVEDRIAIVTHGLVCDELARRHLACDGPAPTSWANSCVTIVAGTPPWRVLRLACTAHLAVIADDTGGRV